MVGVDYSKHQAEIAAATGVPVKLTEEQRQQVRQDHYTEIAVHQALTSEHFRKLLKEEIANALTNAEHLRGSSGNDGKDGVDGAPGKDGATIHEILDVIDTALLADPERFRGAAGSDGAAGAQGEQGLRGPQGSVGSQGEQGLQGKQGEQGLPGERGPRGLQGVQGEPGRDGKDSVSLEQILVAVSEQLLSVLESKVSSQVAASHYAAIRAELIQFESEANLRPSLRPIYSDIAARIRRIIQ